MRGYLQLGFGTIPPMQVLGLDIGTGKVKCCWLDWRGDWHSSPLRWDSLPLPQTAQRERDYATGLPFQILNFLDKHQLALKRLDQVVVCCSHSFSYQPYSASITHLAQILAELFEAVPVSLIRADGLLSPLPELAALPERKLYAYLLTNYYGSALLGSRLIRRGLSLDLGTTTLDVIPIQDGRVDPQGLRQPADYLRFRYTQGRIHWLGLTTVPLCMLAERVPLGRELYQVVPRFYRSDLIFGYDVHNPELLRQHAYGQIFPDATTSRQQLAQFIGLDDTLLSESEIREVRDYLYGQLVDRVASAISEVAHKSFGEDFSKLEIASFALGEELVLRPALEQAGFDSSGIKTLNLGREQDLWSASSVFAMALLALEKGLGHSLEIV